MKYFLSKILVKVIFKLRYLIWELIYNTFRNKYNIDPTFRFNGVGISFYGNGKIIIGSESYIGNYSTIQAHEKCFVKIGKKVSISHNVRIYTSNADADQDFSLKGTNDFKIKIGNVEIGDYCWVGANVFIKEGVKIGANAVIGANSIVTRDIPDFAIAGGVPAKVIRYKNIKE